MGEKIAGAGMWMVGVPTNGPTRRSAQPEDDLRNRDREAYLPRQSPPFPATRSRGDPMKSSLRFLPVLLACAACPTSAHDWQAMRAEYQAESDIAWMLDRLDCAGLNAYVEQERRLMNQRALAGLERSVLAPRPYPTAPPLVLSDAPALTSRLASTRQTSRGSLVVFTLSYPPPGASVPRGRCGIDSRRIDLSA